MSGEGGEGGDGGQGGEGGFESADASVEAAETPDPVEGVEYDEAPETDPEAFRVHTEAEPTFYEANATPETEEERRRRMERESAAMAQGVHPLQQASRRSVKS
ncbi:hypothetical protein ACFYOG_36665 [Streptomyces sp. NPDC007818]|uniref:hypothetical protein n=1 Tax=Streptomyces sp. NPDC007818 TaxID=3364780 RepID=UPI0036932FC1